jgi:hypothetical protein
MSKVVESLVRDAVEKVKTPEFHSAVVAPLFAYILDMLYPYLIVFAGILVVIVVGVIANFGFLVYITT